ncbi:uncharacterized protein DFL_007106 [Arthrobotrys flagrans]|uniref:Uncharacterized protein n=1 Tax=Arthrobotrys flagrans TaxID=97331 RepID=A0A436ZUU3_ARTFL|nr:hypothetical protein DFL_007106 [Arthrobotrys flagrans]
MRIDVYIITSLTVQRLNLAIDQLIPVTSFDISTIQARSCTEARILLSSEVKARKARASHRPIVNFFLFNRNQNTLSHGMRPKFYN